MTSEDNLTNIFGDEYLTEIHEYFARTTSVTIKNKDKRDSEIAEKKVLYGSA